MPTYQYSCTDCGHFFEQVQSFSDASLTECPACQGKLRKVFNAVGVVFKGSGFYRTDSRSENGSKTPVSAGATKDGGKDGAGKDSTGGSGSKDSTGSTSTGSSGSKDSGGGKAANGSTTSSTSSSGTSKSGSAA